MMNTLRGQQGKGRMMRARTAWATALPVLLALALSGCLGLGGGKTPASLLTLTPAKLAPAGARASGKTADAVLVLEPETDKRLAAVRVPVQVNDAEVAYLADAVWVERPARLFRALLAETLRAKGGRLVIDDVQGAGSAGVRLSGRLLEMGYDARSQSAVVRFDAMTTNARGEVATRRFESVVAGVSAKPGSVGPALNRAANDVAQQVTEWMGG